MRRESKDRRVAVLGSELDGLVAALALAQRGAEVTLIEEGELVGGPAAAVEVAPGFRAPLALDRGRLRGDVLRWLEVPAEELAPPAAPVLVGDNGSLNAAQEAPEASEWLAQVEDLTGWARRITHRPAPPLDPRDDWHRALATGFATRLLGKRRLRRLNRVVSLSIADWLGESMGDGPLAAALAAPALESTVGGPMTMGTGLHALLRSGVTGARAARGLPALFTSLTRMLTDSGAEIRLGSPLQGLHAVEDLWIVYLQSGEAIEVDAVVSALPPRRLFADLLAGADAPVEMLESMRDLRCRGNVGIVLLAVEASPPAPVSTAGAIHHVGWSSLAVLEEAADEIKYGRMADAPPLEIAFPAVDDASLAPDDNSVVQVQARFCPPEVDRDQLIEAAVSGLRRLWPEGAERVVAARAWTPADLERDYRLPGGHLEHADWALDQLLFLRPDSRCRGGATPLPGLSICGPGCHPGAAQHGGSASWSTRRR